MILAWRSGPTCHKTRPVMDNLILSVKTFSLHSVPLFWAVSGLGDRDFKSPAACCPWLLCIFSHQIFTATITFRLSVSHFAASGKQAFDPFSSEFLSTVLFRAPRMDGCCRVSANLNITRCWDAKWVKRGVTRLQILHLQLQCCLLPTSRLCQEWNWSNELFKAVEYDCTTQPLKGMNQYSRRLSWWLTERWECVDFLLSCNRHSRSRRSPFRKNSVGMAGRKFVFARRWLTNQQSSTAKQEFKISMFQFASVQ